MLTEDKNNNAYVKFVYSSINQIIMYIAIIAFNWLWQATAPIFLYFSFHKLTPVNILEVIAVYMSSMTKYANMTKHNL